MLNAKKNKCKNKGPMKGKMGKFNEHKEGKRGKGGKGGEGKHGPGGRKGPCGKKFGRRGLKAKCIVKAVLFMIAAVWGATNFPAYFTFFYFLRKDFIRVHQLKQVQAPHDNEVSENPPQVEPREFVRAPVEEEEKEPAPEHPNYSVQAPREPAPAQGFYVGDQYVVPVTREQLDGIMRAQGRRFVQ